MHQFPDLQGGNLKKNLLKEVHRTMPGIIYVFYKCFLSIISEFEKILGDSERQRSLACCNP